MTLRHPRPDRGSDAGGLTPRTSCVADALFTAPSSFQPRFEDNEPFFRPPSSYGPLFEDGQGSYRFSRQRALRVEPSRARKRRSLVTDGRKPGGGARPCPAFPATVASSRRQVSTKSASDAIWLDTSPPKRVVLAESANRCPRRTHRMAFCWTPVVSYQREYQDSFHRRVE